MKVKCISGKGAFWKSKPIDWNGKSKSKLQKDCKSILFLYWNGDNVSEELKMPGQRLFFDFVNFHKKIIVESSGEQHFKYNKFFHNKNIFNLVASKKRDENKRKFAELNEFTFIEVKTAFELNRIMFEMNK